MEYNSQSIKTEARPGGNLHRPTTMLSLHASSCTLHWNGLADQVPNMGTPLLLRPRTSQPLDTLLFTAPLQLKELLDTDFRSIQDFRSKASQYKPHTSSAAGSFEAGAKPARPIGAGGSQAARRPAANGLSRVSPAARTAA